MLSDARVQEVLAEFLTVKVDPRQAGFDREALDRYKSTRYVPEIVLIAPDGAVLGRLDANATIDSAVAALKDALRRAKST